MDVRGLSEDTLGTYKTAGARARQARDTGWSPGP